MAELLRWTGHPLVDVGVAALCAMTDKGAPQALTLDDLDRAAAEMQEYYFSGFLTSYLTCVFMNAEYVQPGSGSAKEASRKKYAQRVLFAHRSEPDPGITGQTCVFSGRPATHLIHRGQMPLLTGEGVLNFYPAARGGLPVCGPYLTALQALPIGGRRVEGKLLVAHADDSRLTMDLARLYVADNRRLFALATAGNLPAGDGPHLSLEREQAAWDAKQKRPKYPDAKSAPSLITADLMDIWETKSWMGQEGAPTSVTVYWLSSSGQGPSLAIYHLPSNLIRFLILAARPSTRMQWRRMVGRGWQDPIKSPEPSSPSDQPKKARRTKPAAPAVTGGPGRSRNEVLSDLFSIYESGYLNLTAAGAFLCRHLLSYFRGAIHHSAECDWSLTELFLKEVFGMQPERIEAIRSFADRLAEHIRNRNDEGLFRSLVYARWPGDFRNALTKAQRNEARSNHELLFGLEEYLSVFEADESVGRVDWSLVRDLISIRLVEQLHKAGFLRDTLLAKPEEVPANAN